MKLFFSIPPRLHFYYKREIVYYRNFFREGDYAEAWKHLERAHIIGQSYPVAHTYAHWLMLKFGFKTKNFKEIIGQLPRLVVGGVKSFVGKVPIGNTGGANVPPLRPMPLPEDIEELFTAKTG